MSAEEKKNVMEKGKSILAMLADFASLIIIPIALWGWFTVNQAIALNRAQIESSAKDAFVSKVEFSDMMGKLQGSDSRLWEKESTVQDQLNKSINDINLKLQHIEDISKK